MGFAIANGARVYYEIHGAGPAVVLAHGAGGHHAIWWQQIPYFRDRYSLVVLDFPGFGNSDSGRGEYDTHKFPGCILAVLDAAGIERAALVGQSLGGPPSLSVAVRHPERVAGVVLAHSIGGISDEEVMAMVRADRAAAETLTVIDRLMSKRVQESEPEKVFLFQQMGTFNAARVPNLRNQWVGATTLTQVEGAMAAGVRVCFIAGDDDAVIRPATYQRVAELLPKARMEVVPGAPHSMYWEAPELFNAALERALDTIYPATAVTIPVPPAERQPPAIPAPPAERQPPAIPAPSAERPPPARR
jgi:pimeloyl-ACP methyl ester carboxylesterase